MHLIQMRGSDGIFNKVWYWLDTPPLYRAQTLINIVIVKTKTEASQIPFIPFTESLPYGEVCEGICVLIRLPT